MSEDLAAIAAHLIATSFERFVRHAFKKTHGHDLGNQPYIEYMVGVLEEVVANREKNLLINLPPQHLKSFVGTICLGAYLLGRNPKLRIILVAYGDDYAASLCERIRNVISSPWYQRAFPTRVRDGHARIHDFATTEGGGIFAVGATGALTGRTADVVLYDDPHQISDWNNPRKIAQVREAFGVIRSRLPDKKKGAIVVIAHRVADNDLSADLIAEGNWRKLALPLVAPRKKLYSIGDFQWLREKGEILRPDAYPAREIKRLERTQIAPPYDLFFQQGVMSRTYLRPRAHHFQSFAPYQRPVTPIVISVDPGQGGGANASRSVVQVWSTFAGNHYLVDQFADHCDLEQQRAAFLGFVRRYNPSAVLIEKAASGPSLYSSVRQRVHCRIELVSPREAKAVRLARHLRTICRGRIYLLDPCPWRDSFIAEVINFPSDHDDQVDAMTQYLDFIEKRQNLPKPRSRDSGFVVAKSSAWRRT